MGQERKCQVMGFSLKSRPVLCSQLTEMSHANYSTTSSVSKPTILHCLCYWQEHSHSPRLFQHQRSDTNTPAHLTPRYQTKHVGILCRLLYALHCECETFWSSASKKFKIKQSCKETEDYIEICVHAVNVKASNMTIICCEFSAVKKGSVGVSTLNLSRVAP